MSFKHAENKPEPRSAKNEHQQQNNLFRGVPATPPYGPEIALFWGRYLIPVRTKRKAKK